MFPLNNDPGAGWWPRTLLRQRLQRIVQSQPISQNAARAHHILDASAPTRFPPQPRGEPCAFFARPRSQLLRCWPCCPHRPLPSSRPSGSRSSMSDRRMESWYGRRTRAGCSSTPVRTESWRIRSRRDSAWTGSPSCSPRTATRTTSPRSTVPSAMYQRISSLAGLLDVDVLKASHHRSRNGTSQAWLDAVTSEDVVISAGFHRGFKHPYREAVDAYMQATEGRVHCTKRHGTIRVLGFRGGRVRVSHQRESTEWCAFVNPD